MGNGITSIQNQYVQNSQVDHDFDLKKDVGNFITNYVQACTDNKMQAMLTLGSLGCITYGLTNGFMTGDFRAVYSGVGMLGMSNLLTGILSDDSNVSQTCSKVGTAASILFIGLTNSSSPFIPLRA